MKPKHPIHHIQLALLGIPFLLLSPAAQAQNQDKDEKAAEVTETEETSEEKGKARRDKEAAKRAEEAAVRARTVAERTKEAAEGAKESAEVAETAETVREKGKARRANEAAERTEAAAERAKVAAERAEDVAKRAQEAAKKSETTAEPVDKDDNSAGPEKSDTPAKGRDRSETAPGARERGERRPAPEPREGRERRERPAVPAVPATPTQPPAPPAEISKPPVDMPVVPSEPLKPREPMKPRGNDVVPGKVATPVPVPDQPEERETFEIPASEPERQAETQVTEVTREVQRDLDQRKTRIEGREEARALIDDILGSESRISRAEIAREERYRPRIERQRRSDERLTEVSPDQRRAATTYFQQRLRGREVEGPPPEFFRGSDRRGERRDPRVDQRVVERVEFVRPRYLNEGRRYVHFDSRAAIPAILMAAQAMNYVRFQPTREIAPMFYEGRDVSSTHAMPLPPENYRSENSLVVSYPVDENSMISSEDILFLQGSTQFSDPYSYEVIAIMADAMKAMPEEDRFVIEGHASAEGSYESNMVLSQQRAEHIVREIVRRGVSPYRLLPVGYGESEARHPADAGEAVRSQDRRVVVFRMKPEPVAKR